MDAKAQFRSLAEPWADTVTSTGRLTLAVLGALADGERELIRTRSAEGRSRAKARGVKLGRKHEIDRAPEARGDRRRDELDEPLREIARSLQCQRQYDFPADGVRWR